MNGRLCWTIGLATLFSAAVATGEPVGKGKPAAEPAAKSLSRRGWGSRCPRRRRSSPGRSVPTARWTTWRP